jgi:hypothetical protein
MERAIFMGVPLGFERAYNFDSSQRKITRTELNFIVRSHIMHTYTILGTHMMHTHADLHHSWYKYDAYFYILSRVGV